MVACTLIGSKGLEVSSARVSLGHFLTGRKMLGVVCRIDCLEGRKEGFINKVGHL